MLKFKTLLLAAAAVGAMTASAFAEEVTLRLHQMLPPYATIPTEALTPWAEKVEAESDGRITVEHYPAMSLGGAPPQLYDQAVDGVVDLVWTIVGYSPGRFPSTEPFELPFMMVDAEITSKAFHEYCETHCADEFDEVKVIAWHTHGPGLIHANRAIESLDDMSGLKIRGGSRVVNQMLEALGAEPVGMPVPQVSESLSRGVLDATTLPWEVTPSLRVSELVTNHTGFTAANGLYTQLFVFAMNKDAYEALPDDLKAVIDANSGIEVAAMFGRVMDAGDAAGLAVAEELGNNIITLDDEETERWIETASPLIDSWIAEMTEQGLDAAALVEEARAMIEKHANSD